VDENMEKIAEADFPTKFGMFRIHAFKEEDKIHLALVRLLSADPEKSIPVRIHSKCLTGDTFASLRCDCRAQLDKALEFLGSQENGVLLYLDQEGRGIGLADKIKAYSLQDSGMDTVEANLELGFAEDLRDYDAAAEILKAFGIKKIRLLTNNPIKLDDMKKHGIMVEERLSLFGDRNMHNEKYLLAKKEKLGHMLE
jgi:3,4-dihydroxy 2-butanone 4-phosphate synthase/GTP cyclohydrolase II